MAGLITEATDQVHGDVAFRTIREDLSEVCEPCKVDNTIQPVAGWCETCDEMLCNDCYKSHCRLKITRNHQLRSLEEMKNRQKTKTIESKCKKHDGKILEYFCEDHGELGCSQCFVTRHRPCSNVVCISEVITSKLNEFKDMQLLLSKLEERLNIIEEKQVRDLSITGSQHNKSIAGIQEAGEKLKSLIDTLVKEQIEKAEMTKIDNIRIIGKVDEMKKGVAEELTSARDMLAAVKGDNIQLFITMKHLQGEVKVLESKLGDSEQNDTIREYEFVLNQELSRLLDTVTELGTLKDTRELDFEKATDEVVDELEVQRFQQAYYGVYRYDGTRPEGIMMSTDRDIRLLCILLYPCRRGAMNVKLNIMEGTKCLFTYTSTYATTDEDCVAVKVLDGKGVHGIPLQAGHWYDIVVTLTGDSSYFGCDGLSEVTMHGVTFSICTSNISRYTSFREGQIPGFRFSL